MKEPTMSEVGSLKVKLECDSDEFMAKMNAARAALEGVAKAADEATAALARLYGSQHVTVNVASERVEEVERAVDRVERSIARGARATDYRFKL